MNYIYIDFEYIEEPDRLHRHLVCVSIYELSTNKMFSRILFVKDLEDEVKIYLNSLDLSETIFLGWAISGAEVPCLYQLMGYNWCIQTKWIDLWVEYKMWILTHQDFVSFSKKDSLLSAIDCFNLNDKYDAAKEDILKLILYDNQNRFRIHHDGLNYTISEVEKILHYCEQDTLILRHITEKIALLSESYGIHIFTHERLSRGEFCMLSGISYEAGNGFPMDIDKVKTIFAQRDRIKKLIQIECNHKTKYHIYMPVYKGPVHKKILVKYSFCHKNFEKYVIENNLYELWERTEKGKQLRLDEDYLDEMLSNHKDVLEPVYHARNTLKQLNSTDLSVLMNKEGYIKCPPFPFHQKTSRSSPKPKLGFILNLSPWLRMLIKPKQNRAFVSIDFKSQEVLIAAVLSHDEQMLDSYLKDYYLQTAIKTGFAPENATKKTHNHIRNPFKGISLGTLYGLQIKSLTFRFMALNKEWSQEEACYEAIRYFENHKQIYYKYWEFIQSNYENSMEKGYFKVDAESGWIYFMRDDTRTTQIQNLPCQSWGAEMMRYSHNDCIKQKIFVIPLHDSLNFECSLDEAIELSQKVSSIMCEASKRLLGCDHMGTTTKIFTHDKPYYDSRGVETYTFIMKELGMPMPSEFSDVKEFENIHLLKNITL